MNRKVIKNYSVSLSSTNWTDFFSQFFKVIVVWSYIRWLDAQCFCKFFFLIIFLSTTMLILSYWFIWKKNQKLTFCFKHTFEVLLLLLLFMMIVWLFYRFFLTFSKSHMESMFVHVKSSLSTGILCGWVKCWSYIVLGECIKHIHKTSTLYTTTIYTQMLS